MFERLETPYKLNRKSLSKLNSCNNRIIIVILEILYYYNITVLEGSKNVEEHSPHKYSPSLAIDISPFPIPRYRKKLNIDDKRWIELYQIVSLICKQKGIDLTWGGYDKPYHYELTDWESLITTPQIN